mgnify:CR=1 FL=1
MVSFGRKEAFYITFLEELPVVPALYCQLEHGVGLMHHHEIVSEHYLLLLAFQVLAIVVVDAFVYQLY